MGQKSDAVKLVFKEWLFNENQTFKNTTTIRKFGVPDEKVVFTIYKNPSREELLNCFKEDKMIQGKWDIIGQANARGILDKDQDIYVWSQNANQHHQIEDFLNIVADISFYISESFELSLSGWNREHPEKWLRNNPNYQTMIGLKTTTSVPSHKSSDWKSAVAKIKVKPGGFERLPYESRLI